MALRVEDLDDETRFRKILTLTYGDMLPFIFEYLRKRSFLIIFFWTTCLLFLVIALKIRFGIAGYYPVARILVHSLLGLLVFPVLSIPLHEMLHILPYYISGARNIRIGMDLKQYLFYVTAHRYVASPFVFKLVALIPYVVISAVCFFLILSLPGLWKWSLSLFLFAHATMCSGDFALLNFYYSRKGHKIFTWDDADMKEAYFYEKL